MVKNLIITFTLLLFLSCEKPGDPTKPIIPIDKDTLCPYPETNGLGWANSPGSHLHQDVSYDLKYLVYEGSKGINVLDLTTGEVQNIDIKDKLPSNVILISVDYPKWCPYDNNRLLLFASTSTDIDGDGKGYKYGHNLYIVSLDGKEFKRVTPTKFGAAGGNFGMPDWLLGSSSEIDSLRFYDDGIYIPQKDLFIVSYFENLIYASQTGNHNFSLNVESIPEEPYYLNKYFINEGEIFFKDINDGYLDICWSPNDKYIALSFKPYQNHTTLTEENARFNEIWIIDVEKYLRERPDSVPVKIINLREKFCMYNLNGGPDAEFITNTTMAVTMHHDGDPWAYLWEGGY